jgi:hypothetical protein
MQRCLYWKYAHISALSFGGENMERGTRKRVKCERKGRQEERFREN